jgi:eukaryotic-like serine/threonine-protein kinase
MITDTGRLGPFALEEKLGPGDDCAVYRAVHLRERRSFAVKVLPIEVPPGATAEAAFGREVGALKSLQHPHIVCCYGGGRHHGQAYLVFELVHGEPLDALLARHAPVAWQTAAECALQVCAGLEYLQQRGIVHRRLTPARLLVSEEGHVKISGLGLEQVSNGLRPLDEEPTLATAPYLAPEVAANPAAATHRSDLYALGCILFELLTGQPPFTGDTVESILGQHAEMPPPRISQHVFDCPIWLETLVGQLLEKDPARRPAFASAVAVALEETKTKVAEGGGVVAHALSGNASVLRAPRGGGEARKLFGRKRQKAKARGPFYERLWFLLACIGLLVAGAAWALWPMGEDQLIARAEALMASGDRAAWQEARAEYLEPLLRRFPNGRHAARAREHLDTIEMEQAETRLAFNTRLGREPGSEGERLYADAWRYEQFGDRVTALRKYEGLVSLLSEDGPDRPYVRLARRQRERILATPDASADRAKLLDEKLRQADRMLAQGDPVAAHQIWLGIVSLYGDNKELRKQVAKAQARLAGQATEEEPTAAEHEAEDNDADDQPPTSATGPRTGSRP